MQIDKGGIKFVFGGAHVMCPGLTSQGAKMEDVEKNTVVGIYCEGKEHALAVGLTKLSTKEIQETNKDIGILNYHYLDD